jgi:hypothetical protein
LTPFVDTPLDTRLYEAWLSLIKYDFPFNWYNKGTYVYN